jgi:hypothetical protein
MIRAGKLLEKRQRKRFGQQYLLPKSSGSLPYIRYSDRELTRAFQDAFFDITVALSVEPASSQYTTEAVIPGSPANYSISNHVYLELATLEALRDLYAGVEAIAAGAYHKGRQDGRDFVRGLCEGSVSLLELNEETARYET